MSEQIKGIYLCLLDDVSLDGDVTLDEFTVRYYGVEELISLLIGSDEGISSEEKHRLELYSEFPWACMEEDIPPDKIKTDFNRILLRSNLAFKHAGIPMWEPFTDLIRTLNLLKGSPGPVITRQFYFTLYPNTKTKTDISRVIYGEPSFDIIDNGNSSRVRPLLLEYALGQKDVPGFSNLREQLNRCLSKDSNLPNSHLRIAIHYFENGDRKFRAIPLTGSFNAIDPLMSYEAALEALVILECEKRGVCKNLSSRVSGILGDKAEEVCNFLKRVFWLRSKVAHGVRTVEEIESLIIDKPNVEIQGEARGKPIPEGNYDKLFLESYVFAGFLVNLREITRRTIRFFCREHLKGHRREDIIDGLNK